MNRKQSVLQGRAQADILCARNILSDTDGNAGVLIGVMLTFVFALLFVLHAEMAVLNNKSLRVQNALDASISAASTHIHMRSQAIPPAAAKDRFLFHLRANLMLNEDLTPQAGSIASNPVTYQFYVYNAPLNNGFGGGVIGDPTPTGIIVNDPGIWAEVTVPIRPFFVGILGEHINIVRHRLVEFVIAR